MAYTPRPWTWQTCPTCQVEFAARHRRRRYCSHSCNVRASYARTGRRGTRATPLATAPAPADVQLRPTVTPAPVVPPPRQPGAAPRAAAATPRPTMNLATAARVEAFCHALTQTLRRTKAEQAAFSQFVDRLLQPYR